jgi:hypothetical protein
MHYFNLRTRQFQFSTPNFWEGAFIFEGICESTESPILKLTDVSGDKIPLRNLPSERHLELKAIELFRLQDPLFMNLLPYFNFEFLEILN